MRDSGFTLIEVLVSVSILVIAVGVAYMSFSVVTQAYRRGMELSDDLHHGDFVIEQLVAGLRSAYYPDAKGVQPKYGFHHSDDGTDPYSSDVISWVKTGGALISKEQVQPGTPHRIEFFVEPGVEEEPEARVRAWRMYGLPEDFDPEESEPLTISRKVTGFNCRTALRKVDGEIEWLDEWEETNRLPMVAEVTVYMEPLDEDEDPVEIKRIVGIPVAPQAW